MNKVIWSLPMPSANLMEAPLLQRLPRKVLVATLVFQEESEERFVIHFCGVEAFKWTSLSSCKKEMIDSAYDKLIECGQTEWLLECQEISARVEKPKSLHHYRIFFDEGPCLEVIGESVSVES